MKIEEEKNIAVITPEMHQIDVNNSPRFREELERELEGRGKVILDLGNINFMDSTALGIIVSALRTMNGKKGRMALCGATPAVKVLFDMVRMSQIARIYGSREEAIGSFES